MLYNIQLNIYFPSEYIPEFHTETSQYQLAIVRHKILMVTKQGWENLDE